MEIELKAFKDFLNSKEGKKATQEFANSFIRNQLRVDKAYKYLERLNETQFLKLMDRLVNEHDETHREKCWLENCEPYPNGKLELFIKVASKYGKPSNKSFGNKYFHFNTYQYRDFYVNMMYGQGTAISVYYHNKLVIDL